MFRYSFVVALFVAVAMISQNSAAPAEEEVSVLFERGGLDLSALLGGVLGGKGGGGGLLGLVLGLVNALLGGLGGR